MDIQHYDHWEDEIKTYLSASKLFNFFLDDPLLDYLDYFADKLGLMPNDCPEEVKIIMEKGNEFERKVVEVIENLKRIPIYRVKDYNTWVDGSLETLRAMKSGQPIIYQGYLINPNNKTKGRPDILIRSDYLNYLKDGLLSPEEIKIPSKFGDYHYRVIDIKLSNLSLTANGKYILNTKLYKTYKAQVLVYNLALGYLQNYHPPQGYLLGRSAHNYDNSLYYNNCFSSITQIDYEDYDFDFLKKLDKALEWHQKLKEMNSPEIDHNGNYNFNNIDNQVINQFGFSIKPNMKNKYDFKWNHFKKDIAEKSQDLTLLWNCGTNKRDQAIQNGINGWEEYMKYCQDKQGFQNNVLAEIIKTNLDENKNIIRPSKIDREFLEFIPKLDNPFIVLDFEVSNNLNDNFDNLPYLGGSDVIFLIGATLVVPMGNQLKYQYFYFLIDHLTPQGELNLLIKFLGWIKDMKKMFNNKISFYHWSQAEPIFFEKMVERLYNNLKPSENDIISDIKFIDLLSVFRYQPITIKGSFDFGLKNIAKALHKHGFIDTIWENDINGLLAMLRIHKYSQEAEKLNIVLNDFEEIKEIIHYNMVDCQVLAEIAIFLQNYYLRKNNIS